MWRKKQKQTDNTNGCNTEMINTIVWVISVLISSGSLLEPKFVFTKCQFTTQWSKEWNKFLFYIWTRLRLWEACNLIQSCLWNYKSCENIKKSKSVWQISFSCVCVLGCAGCGRDIKNGQALLALDSQWHLGCFKCKACAKVLTGEYISK